MTVAGLLCSGYLCAIEDDVKLCTVEPVVDREGSSESVELEVIRLIGRYTIRERLSGHYGNVDTLCHSGRLVV